MILHERLIEHVLVEKFAEDLLGQVVFDFFAQRGTQRNVEEKVEAKVEHLHDAYDVEDFGRLGFQVGVHDFDKDEMIVDKIP